MAFITGIYKNIKINKNTIIKYNEKLVKEKSIQIELNSQKNGKRGTTSNCSRGELKLSIYIKVFINLIISLKTTPIKKDNTI